LRVELSRTKAQLPDLGSKEKQEATIAEVEKLQKSRRQAHVHRVAEVMGKYSSVPTSSEEFARRKRNEIERER